MAKAFSGGVGKGGLHNTEDIKLLVMYVLRIAAVPFSLQSIINSITQSELANTFEVSSAAKELCNDKLALQDDDGMFTLTKKGESTVDELYKLLNVYVLEEAKRCTAKEVIMARRLRENTVTITHDDENDGYLVDISMNEMGRKILGLQIKVATLEDAQAVKKRVLENTVEIYSQNIKMLLGFDVNNNENGDKN